MAVYHQPTRATGLRRLFARLWVRTPLPQIIINHVDEDQELADLLCGALQDSGRDAASNRHLPVGRRLDEYLDAALTSVDCVLTIWSVASVTSARVRDVANEAQRLGISVPVALEMVTLPLGHRSVRTVQISAQPEASIQPVLQAVEAIFSGEASFDAPESELGQPSLSTRIARRVINALLQEGQTVRLPEPAPIEHFFLGPWCVDAGANLISRDGVEKRMPPRAMEVLVYLVSRAPATVSVDDILDTVWKDRVVVDSAVHRCVRELRIAFEDDARDPEIIETIARRGYRLVASVALEHQPNVS